MFKTCSLLLVFSFTAAAHAQVAVANFDNFPTGPSYFSNASAPQAINYPGVATFTGGVILGDASNLPGQAYATPPNAYGTAGFANDYYPGFTDLLTVTVDPTFTANEVSFALLNGATITSSYQVEAFNGANLLDTEDFTLAPNTASGYALPDLLDDGITSVTITSLTDDPNVDGWDFFIDSVAFNENINQELNPSPEPSSMLLLGTGLLGGLGAAYRRLRTRI